jgi:hypothetical protein
MRDQVQFVRQNESQGVARKWANDAANVLHRITTQVDLDLEIFMTMGRGFRFAFGLATDIKVRPLAALLHAECGDAIGRVHHGFLIVLLLIVSCPMTSFKAFLLRGASFFVQKIRKGLKIFQRSRTGFSTVQ